MFEEYVIMVKRVDIDSSKNDIVRNKKRLQANDRWANHQLFGSRMIKKIRKTN